MAAQRIAIRDRAQAAEGGGVGGPVDWLGRAAYAT